MRFFRLGLGLLIIAQGVKQHEWMVMVGGVLLSLLPVFNIGCCGVSSCGPRRSSSQKQPEEITFEEIR